MVRAYCVGSTSEGDSTIADDEETELSCDEDDDDDDDDDVDNEDETCRRCDDTMIKEASGNDEVSYTDSKSLKVEENVDMKTFNAEDEAEVENTLYTDDGFPSTPGKREEYDSPEVKRSRSTPERQVSLSSPAVESVLHESAGSFSEPLGSSVARLESFVASVVAADRKRPVPFREPCASPPPPPPPPPAPATRSVPPALPLVPIPSRSRQSKVVKSTSRASKSPTSMSQSGTGGRTNRSTRVAANISLPSSLVSPSPSGQSGPDQPLDLSTKSRRESQYLSPDVASAGPSSLLSLERQFGKGSAIFDRIGTKAWAAPYCAAALRLGVQSLAFGGGLGLVSPPSPSPTRRLGPGRPYKDRETVAYPPPPVGRQQLPPPISPSATTTDVSALLPWAQLPESKRIPSSSSTSTSSGTPASSHVHTNLRCGCGASMDSLFALTVY